MNQYAKECGLSGAPQKSELLVVRRRRIGQEKDDIQTSLEGPNIRPTKSLRILGLTIQADAKNDLLLQHLIKTTDQVIHMIRRVTNRQKGMKERDTVRLVQAFVLSRITYAAPYVTLDTTERDKIDVVIKKAFKQALGLPMSTSTNKLLKMGLHNTVDELIEGHLSKQRARLGLTPAGRRLLERLQWTPHNRSPPKEIPKEWRNQMRMHPVPRNMHPE